MIRQFHTGLKVSPLTCRSGFIKKQRLFFFAFFICATISSVAQAPTSLQYPAANTFIANETNVSLAPTMAGSTAGLGYTIAPALPAGLSFSTSTGIISGVATASSAATTYTVTATNGSGSTNTTLSIAVVNNYYDVAYGQVSFLAANRTFKVGNGQAAGDIALYSNVVTVGGQAIDCIVKTISVTNVSSWSSYDQPLATDGSTFNSNDDKFFSPQVVFGTGGGNIIFDFQFILSGTYNNGTNTGNNVTLQNVLLNTYDIDGNGTAASNQFNEFEGFSKSELGSSSTINAPVYDATLGLSNYLSSISTNNLTVTSDATRVRLTYNNMSSYRIQVGAGAVNAAYYFLDFSSGPAFATAVASFTPAIDLNTSLTGTDNGASGCASALNFSKPGQTNVTSPSVLNEMIISYDNTVANIPDGATELLLINGATAGTASHALNFTTGSTSSVTVGGVAYTITKTVTGTTNIISFVNGATTFTVAQAEALLDALQYSNSLATPTLTDRTFSVKVRNTQFVSPDAVFTASLNCVYMSGNIYHDANGLTDNTINANGSMGQFGAAGAYAVLTNPTTNAVLSTVAISAGGGYTFGRQSPGSYNIFISNTATPGATLTASTYPAGNYKSMGENLGASTGNDGLIDSKITVTLGSIAVINANLGIQIPPAATDFNSSNQANPGGYNFYTVPSANFVTSDADGTVQSITITSFPTGANYLKVGSTIYTNGGTCPPQSSCTAWPGTLVIPFGSINTLAIDPTATGSSSVTLQYTSLDNANARSNNNVATSITIPFIVPATPITISGNVWNDANGNGIKEAGEGFSAAASSGQILYALLIQNTNTYSGAATIYTAATVVSATTGFTFSNVPAGNTYEVRIVSLATMPADGIAKSLVTPALATTYIGISTNNGGTITASQNTNDLVNTLGVLSADRTGVNFGIERAPDTSPFTTGIATPAVNSFITLSGGSNPPVFAGIDAEDQPTTGVLTGKTIGITSLPANGQLFYNGLQLTKGDDNINPPSVSNPKRITGYNPALMQIRFTGSGYNAISFTYAYVDAAGIMDQTPSSYSVNWSILLPVRLTSFTVKAAANVANLIWTTADEINFKEYVVERSLDGINFTAITTVTARGGQTNNYKYADDVTVLNASRIYYRLKQVDNDGKFNYSGIVSITFSKANGLLLTVSPNPATGPVTIVIKAEVNSAGHIKISDYSGKIVVTKSVSIASGTNTISIEANKKLANGIYLASLEVNGATQTFRFIIKR